MQRFLTKIEELRKKAEYLLSNQPTESRQFQQDDIEKILHELDVYQIELQLQNEELLISQKETKVSLSKYQDLYDFSPIGILTIDAKGIIHDINLTACSLLGKGRSFLKEKPFSAYLAGESHETFFNHLQNTIDSGSKQTCEVKVYNAQNEIVFFQIESVFFLESNKNLIRSAILDITEKKIAFSTIKDRDSLLRSLMESSQLAVIIFEIKGYQSFGQPILKLWDFNPKASVLFSSGSLTKGVTPEELLNSNFRYMDSFIEDIYSVAQTGSNIIRDVKFPLPKKFANFKVNIVKFLHGVSLTFTDVTKEIESSRQKELILSTIVDNLPDQDVHVFNSEKKIITSGGKLSESLGIPIRTWLGNRPNEMFSGELGAMLETIFEDALLGRTVEKEFSLFGIPVLCIAIPILDDNEEVSLGLCLIKNISNERKRTNELEEEKLNLESRIRERAKELVKVNQEYREELEKKKILEKELLVSRQWESIGNLAAGIAHDFNNILQPINTYTTLSESLLELGNEDSIKKIKTYLARIKLSSEKGKNIVQQVLNFSKTKEESFDPIDICIEIEEAVKSIREEESREVIFINQLSEKTCYALSYSSGVFQIAFNLLQNAIHATAHTSNPKISISLDQVNIETERSNLGLKLIPGKYYAVLIEDNGTGISSTKYETIFEAFFTEKENLGGTGLGLAIVHGILKRIKGGIELESQVGLGSKFIFYLPVAAKQKEFKANDKNVEEKEVKIENAGLSDKNPRILLVDDDELILASLKDAFRIMGFSVIDFNSGEMALSYFENNQDKIDILITDQKMQGMDGTDLVERLKRLAPDLPAIVCTGYSSILNGTEFPPGVNKIFVKPIDMYEVSREVKRILTKKR